MLNLYDIFWVIPGIVFVYFYNKRRPVNFVSLTGWQYVFFLVLIAAFTWTPAEIIMEAISREADFLGLYLKTPVWRSWVTLLISLIFVCIGILVIQVDPLVEFIFPDTYDNFCKKCIAWENETVILTLKNSKVYIASLWKYPENPKSQYEFQTISIVPFVSGYKK